MKHLKKLIQTSLFIALFSGVIGLATTAVSAAASTPTMDVVAASATSALKQDACKGLRQVDNKQGCGTGSKSFYRVIKVIVNLISYLAGIVAVIMIMVAGVRYMTSGGDSNGVASAKTALVYALVGIVIVALSQFLVQVVLSQATKSL